MYYYLDRFLVKHILSFVSTKERESDWKRNVGIIIVVLFYHNAELSENKN